MLRALHQLLRPGGRMAFTIIQVAPGLDAASRRRARRCGPRAVATRSAYERLLTSAGFADVEAIDITPPFIETARAWIELRQSHAAALAPLEPPGAFDTRQREHRAQLAAIERGLLQRALLTARRPARS